LVLYASVHDSDAEGGPGENDFRKVGSRFGFPALAEDEEEALEDGLDCSVEGLIEVTPEIYRESSEHVGQAAKNSCSIGEEAMAFSECAERDCVTDEQACREGDETGIEWGEEIEARIEGNGEECAEYAEGKCAPIEAELFVRDDGV
jgi:hypothetical protein